MKTDANHDTYRRMMESSKRLFTSSSQIAALRSSKKLDTPIKGKIKKGTVAAVKEAFDRLADGDIDAERNV